ncbi:outer membrane protein OmpA-like peptidoglycan-associated protein [Rhizobium sp. BK529]|uniref:OmpA family protein n=1 Tax=unclassified Rhizobium TaxID=2613769 RepID=UPI001053BF24|nr:MULTISPECIES: OmpA family protein [unclassified Rhizobium]MBB3590979.1 outer membrane protein OmpA-like peptidoglycan-associated protein [Rhizobium sp. BK529]TCS09068.1 outer membrane protein OmpA-like peptidoglycan-associated protein [Rhizobium sp. BK418]
MGMKSRLFASAAFPLLSLALAMPPMGAYAAVSGGVQGAVQPVVQGSYEVAQDAPSEEELLKKKKKLEEQQQQQKEAPAEKPRQSEAPQEKPQMREAPAENAPEQKPKRQREPEPQAAPEAQPPAAEEPARPRKRQAQPEQAAPEQQAPAAEEPQRPRRQKQAQPEPQAVQPQTEQQPQAEQPKAEQPKRQRDRKQNTEQAAPEAQPPAEQAPTAGEAQQPAEKPRQRQKPTTAEQPAEQTPQQSAEPPQGGKQAAPGGKKLPATEQQSAPSGEAPKPAEKPATAEQPAPAEKPATAEKPAPAEKPATAEKPAAGEQPATGQAVQPAPGQQPTAIAPQPGEQPAAGAPQQTEQAIPAPEKITPQELQRRKEIAKDPAKSNETIVLPVENGAAVLDSDKDADRSQGQQGRRNRDRQRAQSQEVPLPKSDAQAQVFSGEAQRAPVQMEAVTREEGRRIDSRPQFARPEGANYGEQTNDNRVIIQFGDRTVVRSDDDRRFLRDGERPTYEELSGDRYRETIIRPEGYRIVTIRNRYGDIIQRSRIDARGREDVLYYSPELYEDPNRDYFEDPGADLPPMRLSVPLDDYIIDTSTEPDRDYYEFLSEPPVEPVERIYSLNEVKYSARIRDKVRRIDLDTITFATGSAEVPMSQARTLRKVADAIKEILDKNASETFLIEGHTDAVGSAQSNLILSDQRAESVANVLTDVYGIPAENLATQGYGEQYLKVNTLGPNQENRRVTIRRVTPLVRPVAQNR